MSREDDKKIAEWVGWKRTTDSVYGICWLRERRLWLERDIPNSTTSDSDAITLLPVLVERGYSVDLFNDADKWLFIASKVGNETDGYVEGLTISASITSAILQLIDKEKESGL